MFTYHNGYEAHVAELTIGSVVELFYFCMLLGSVEHTLNIFSHESLFIT